MDIEKEIAFLNRAIYSAYRTMARALADGKLPLANMATCELSTLVGELNARINEQIVVAGLRKRGINI